MSLSLRLVEVGDTHNLASRRIMTEQRYCRFVGVAVDKLVIGSNDSSLVLVYSAGHDRHMLGGF